MADYILKLFDRELIRFSAKDTGDIPEISITHIDQDALSLMPLGMEVSDKGLARWLKHRKIPRNRAYIHSFLAKTGLSTNSTMGIIDVSKGLSLNDSYWVVREGDSKILKRKWPFADLPQLDGVNRMEGLYFFKGEAPQI